MAASYRIHHMERSHGILLPLVRGVEVGEGGTDIYKMPFLRILKSVECLVEGCSQRSNTPGRMRGHLMYPHWK